MKKYFYQMSITNTTDYSKRFKGFSDTPNGVRLALNAIMQTHCNSIYNLQKVEKKPLSYYYITILTAEPNLIDKTPPKIRDNFTLIFDANTKQIINYNKKTER